MIANYTIIELKVRNHPGVMAQITALFSRRAFNLEGIFCVPVGKGMESIMLLMTRNNGKLPQVIFQLEKLYDVLSVKIREDIDGSVFGKLGSLLPG